MTASIFPLPCPSGIYSLRVYETGSGTGNFSDNEFLFYVPGNVGEDFGGIQTGITPVTVTDTLSRSPVTPGTVTIYWNKSIAVVSESPTMTPPTDGTTLSFTTTFGHFPITNDPVTIAWTESTIAKTATLLGANGFGGTNGANIASVTLNRTTGALAIVFAAGHAPDATSITLTYNYEATASSVTDSGAAFAASGVTGTINYTTGDISITFVGASVVPANGDQMTVTYTGPQGWSHGIRVVSTAGGYVEISFDGTNVHGRVDNGAEVEYWDRYEAGIAVRGSGPFIMEAW